MMATNHEAEHKARAELKATVARPSAHAGLVRRARVVLVSAEGISAVEIEKRLDLSPETVSRIRKRYNESRCGLRR